MYDYVRDLAERGSESLPSGGKLLVISNENKVFPQATLPFVLPQFEADAVQIVPLAYLLDPHG